MRGALCTK